MRLRRRMPEPTATEAETPQVVPTGSLRRLKPSEVIPSRNNPRHLFDPEPLRELKESIRQHGVLVPITVYQPKGQSTYSILDGERRHRCCVELEREGIKLDIPANVVDPPDKLAGLLYMFNIHNFREGWELMPTALGLQVIMEDRGETDNKALSVLTRLSDSQITRCKILLSFDPRFQQMSLDPDPTKRIPPNFWIEAYPVIELCSTELPDLIDQYGRDGIIDRLVEKYRAGAIKSVIHFRRIMEAYGEDEKREEVLQKLREYVTDIQLDTKKAFDGFVEESRRIRTAVESCSDFLKQVRRLKVEYVVERNDLTKALEEVRDYVEGLLQKLSGGDAPTDELEEDNS